MFLLGGALLIICLLIGVVRAGWQGVKWLFCGDDTPASGYDCFEVERRAKREKPKARDEPWR